jgi:thiol-disulfide isomerase/thioredoxin
MSDEDPLLPAPRRALFPLNLAALTASLLLGCAAKEGATPSSPQAPVTTTADAVPAASEESSDSSLVKTPSRVETPTDSAARSTVTVEPVAPEEFQKFIAGQRGKVVFVDFWATYCLPCREKFPRTLALAKKYGDQGLTVVSMSMDSPEPAYQKKILEFLTQQNSQIKNFANRLEDTDAAFAALDIVGGALPHYKIYGRNGKLRNKFGGDPDHPFDEADIERALVAALKEN